MRPPNRQRIIHIMLKGTTSSIHKPEMRNPNLDEEDEAPKK